MMKIIFDSEKQKIDFLKQWCPFAFGLDCDESFCEYIRCEFIRCKECFEKAGMELEVKGERTNG